MIRIDKHTWQLFIAGKRVHGFAVGMFLCGAGLALIVHDAPDWRIAFRA